MDKENFPQVGYPSRIRRTAATQIGEDMSAHKSRNSDGTSVLHTFPYWIYVDTSDPPGVEEIRLGEAMIRVYPPFRSAEPSWMPNPPVNPHSIPFAEGTRPEIAQGLRFLTASAYFDFREKKLVMNWGEDWGLTPPREMPMDSMRLDQYGVQAEQANSRLQLVLDNLRWRSRQSWISRSMTVLYGTVRNAMRVDERGTPRELPYAMLTLSYHPWSERPVNSEIWKDAIRAASNQESVPLQSELLLDARFYRLGQDYRRMVLDLATACEFAKDRAIERAWKARNTGVYRRGKVLQGYDLPQHVSRSLDIVAGRNFARERPDDFTLIQKLWGGRGEMAHGGRLNISVKRVSAKKLPASAEVVLLYDVEVDKYFDAAERLLDWLDDLA